MKGRPNNTYQKNPTVDSISLNKADLQEPAKNHLLDERWEKHEKQPGSGEREIGSELRRIHVSKVMGRPLRSVKYGLSGGEKHHNSNWNSQRKDRRIWVRS